ncbi:uncharacterized protein VTP21DRAFT_4126 [Calcarisporiella thermophila]|uniref:uncharacterized protein n=1 Tax=Calcarisporiella thermophila TaxID=911321 RepID=UPI0037437D66
MLTSMEKTFVVVVLLMAAFASAQNPGAAAPSNLSCLADMSRPQCASFQLDEATIAADLKDLCTEMPFMSGCTVQKTCQETPNLSSSKSCNSFSLLADICATDMPRMRGCKNYVALCSRNATYTAPRGPQCDAQPALSGLPTTMEASDLVGSICTEMDMDGCEKCPKMPPGSLMTKCDPFAVYSQLCQAMPDMRQCGKWKTMCAAASELPYCTSDPSSSTSAPQMRMYFHTGLMDYVLFREWVPRTPGQYAGAWIAIFIIAILYEALTVSRSILEARWAQQSFRSTDMSDGLTKQSWIHRFLRAAFTREGVTRDFKRAALQFVDSTIAYALMLVTMTFNVGLFFAVVGGIAVGTFLFGRYKPFNLTEQVGGCPGCGK